MYIFHLFSQLFASFTFLCSRYQPFFPKFKHFSVMMVHSPVDRVEEPYAWQPRLPSYYLISVTDAVR